MIKAMRQDGKQVVPRTAILRAELDDTRFDSYIDAATVIDNAGKFMGQIDGLQRIQLMVTVQLLSFLQTSTEQLDWLEGHDFAITQPMLASAVEIAQSSYAVTILQRNRRFASFGGDHCTLFKALPTPIWIEEATSTGGFSSLGSVVFSGAAALGALGSGTLSTGVGSGTPTALVIKPPVSEGGITSVSSYSDAATIGALSKLLPTSFSLSKYPE